MRRTYDDRELEELERSRETDITLGSTSVLILFFGLVLVCGACFGLGYSVGHRSPAEPVASGPQPAAGGDEPVQPSSSHAKPSATASVTPAPQPAQAVVSLPTSNPGGDGGSGQPAGGKPAAGPGSATSSVTGAATAAGPAQWTVKPAMPAQAVEPTPGSVAGMKVAPATAPGLALMVQIAAVSHTEDSDVLVSALRKRGYAVTVRRDLADSLIHVQIGPFGTAADAEAMRQKLLNDGYNAIVEP
jgi:DedD protein